MEIDVKCLEGLNKIEKDKLMKILKKGIEMDLSIEKIIEELKATGENFEKVIKDLQKYLTIIDENKQGD